MVCIYCKSGTEVTNSRAKALTPSVWRRRMCKSCVAQFTTTELPVYEKSLSVSSVAHKKSRPFSRDKLFLSLYKSLGHRQDALNSSTALTGTVIGHLISSRPHDGLINPHTISKLAYETLKRYDTLAASSYKAYHQATLILDLRKAHSPPGQI